MNPLAKQVYGMLEGQENQIFRVLRGPYSQAELAKILQTHQDVVLKWERGHAAPQADHVRGLLKHAHTWTAEIGLRLVDLLDEYARRREETTP